MILTILVGNTRTRLTWLDHEQIRRRIVLATEAIVRHGTWAEVTNDVVRMTKGVALASVVPKATRGWCRLLHQAGVRPLVVGPRTRTGLVFRYRRAQLGADRVCLAVGAHSRFRDDLIVLDFGTAITVNVVTRKGEFLGGAILPGLRLMLAALARGTAIPWPMPKRRLVPRTVLGHGTAGAIRSGVSFLLAGGISHIIERIRKETQREYRVVATGGDAGWFCRHLNVIRTVDQDLAARGLARLFYINRRS